MPDTNPSKQKPGQPKETKSFDADLKLLLEQKKLKNDALKKIYDFFKQDESMNKDQKNDD